ncbi:TadE/TadG family type IV pilus assembly protein [Ahrensia kielensis]|uniref:TadE/TadG family type IV pilus assembly protein n=1 Tax=Ahrensia kielensis TaxID=76980 RepID=UPI0003770BE0|nr:TadE/TadG family type IV pilus assembly protein [Ahrensia kielensis]
MSSHKGVFQSLRGVLKHKLISFGRQERGAIAVEMAFILPIFAAMAFLTYDAGTVYTQYKRGTRNYYALGDIIAYQTANVTCSQLDKISEMVYQSYVSGNWARRVQVGRNDFTEDGALDFRFTLRVVNIDEDPVDKKLKGRIEWSYWRDGHDMDDPGEPKPGDYIEVPEGLQIKGLEAVLVQGSLYVAPALNYLGVFDFDASSNETHKIIDVERYFPLRFVSNLDLDFSLKDPLSRKCWVKGVPYLGIL